MPHRSWCLHGAPILYHGTVVHVNLCQVGLVMNGGFWHTSFHAVRWLSISTVVSVPPSAE